MVDGVVAVDVHAERRLSRVALMVRRVLAGVGPTGESSILSESVAPRSHDFTSVPGLSDTLAWVVRPPGDERDDVDGTEKLRSAVPASGETFVRMVRVPPDHVFSSPAFDPSRAAAETALVMDGVEMLEDGLHRTPTIDIVTLISGRLRLIMGDGSTADVHHGDVVIQLGGLHRWSNPGDSPALMFVVHLGRS